MWTSISTPVIELPVVFIAFHSGIIYTGLFNLLYLKIRQTSQSLSAYTLLCEKYKQFLERDPQYLEYLDKIGQHFFGVPPPVKPRPGGMFSGIFHMKILNTLISFWFH